LFAFVSNVEAMIPGSSGWGRLMRTSIKNWYTGRKPLALASAITKYQQRGGWAHRDLLRLSHAKPNSPAQQMLFKYATKGWAAVQEDVKDASEWADETAEDASRVVGFLRAVEEAKTVTEETRLLELIHEHRLVREHVPTSMLGSPAVWTALLREMPMTALLRNLNKLTQVGVLRPENVAAVDSVCARLCDETQLCSARIHPLNVLVALRTYSQGHGERGSLEWTPTPAVIKALDRAFYASFSAVVPTGKRFVLGLDVSGSMAFQSISGMGGLTPRDGAAAMAMVTLRTEPLCRVMAFQDKFVPLPLQPTDTLEQATHKTSNLSFGATDCALPMTWALNNKVEADVFVVYTDSETWAGRVHPLTALKQYRVAMGIDAKLIVVGMVSNGFTIADPADPGMLDVVGFDTSTPEIMRAFAAGEI
jgi:60 kDa SS-A/Ro ribonucleoprotein